MATLVDSYSESNRSTNGSVRDDVASRFGQSFTAIDGVLNSVKFDIQRVGSPSGNLIANIYAHTGTYGTNTGKPTGSPIATSDPIDVTTISTSEHLETLTFSGGNKITLVGGTYYCVVLERSGGSAWNGSNYIWIGCDNTSPTHSGTTVYYTSSWGAYGAGVVDTCFYVYVDDAVAILVKTKNGLAQSSIKTYNGLATASVKSVNGLSNV